MRTILGLVSLLQLAGCKAAESPTDAGAGSDALPPIPQVAPCEVLGLPGPPSMVTRGPNARYLKLRDLDGDGKLDVAVIDDPNVGTVRMFPGNGDASFRASIDSALGSSAPGNVYAFFSSMEIADANGDGKLDLVLATGPDQAVLVALGDGTGHFTPGPVTPGPPGTDGFLRAAVADLNGDRKPDLVLTRSNVAAVTVRLGNGDGTFGNATAYPVGSNPVAVEVADLDGDGIVDAIVANGNDTLSILQGKGDGTFKPKVDRNTLRSPFELTAADLDGDHKVDLVVQSAGGLSVLMNDGNGMLRDHVNYTDLPGTLHSLKVVDINRDGQLDVVAVASDPLGVSADNLLVFAGNGDGTLQRPVATPGYALQEIAVGDVSGDQAQDVVMTSAYSGVFVLESDGRGGLLLPTTYATTAHSTAVVTADLDHDGYVDVALTNAMTSSIGIALGRSEGRFADLVSYPVAAAGTPVVQDVNGDGIADLVVPSRVGSGFGLSVLPGNGDGSFREGLDSPFAVQDKYLFAFGDLNGDGKLDIAIAANSGTWLGVVAVYVGNGDGSFHPGGDLAALDGQPTSLQLTDINGDGRLDVVTGHRRVLCAECGAHPGTDGIAVLLNNGDGTLQPAVPYTGAGGLPSGPLMVDITGDGKLDIVTADALGVHISPGNGDGSFQPTLTYPYPVTGPFGVADINRDGRLDIITPGDGFNVLFARCVR